jgi:hypothetical protein
MEIIVRKITILGLTLVCFGVAAERIRDFYITSLPIGFVGECFDIKFPNFKFHYKMLILSNDMDKKESYVEFSRTNGNNNKWRDIFGFEQEKMINAKRMKCNE